MEHLVRYSPLRCTALFHKFFGTLIWNPWKSWKYMLYSFKTVRSLEMYHALQWDWQYTPCYMSQGVRFKNMYHMSQGRALCITRVMCRDDRLFWMLYSNSTLLLVRRIFFNKGGNLAEDAWRRNIWVKRNKRRSNSLVIGCIWTMIAQSASDSIIHIFMHWMTWVNIF